MTTLHAGGKFSDKNYLHSGGLHGVGASVVNALSKELIATVKRDGFEWQQRFVRGISKGDVEKIGKATGHGTSIFFRPDEDIFPRTDFVPDIIKTHIEDVSYIHPGLKITFVDEPRGEKTVFSNPGGIKDYLTKVVEGDQKKFVVETAFVVEKDDTDKVQVALAWTESTDEIIRSYCNGIRTRSGGTHEAGLRSAVVKAVRNFMETHEIPLKGVTITAEDIREGLVGVLSVLCASLSFRGKRKRN